MEKNNIIVPIAIILAGGLIGAGIYFNGQGLKGKTTTYEKETAKTSYSISIPNIKTGDHVLGTRTAPIIFVEYSDMECPYCKGFHQTMNKIVSEYSDKIAWVYRHMPIETLHKKAKNEAHATECVAELAGEAKFWDFINKIYNITTSNDRLDQTLLAKTAKELDVNEKDFASCMTSDRHMAKIEESIEEAKGAGITGTPTTVVLLKNPAKQGVVDFIDDVNLQLGLPPKLFSITDDRTKIFIGGNLQYSVLNQLIKALSI